MKQPKSQPQAATKAAIYCRISTNEQGKGDFSSLNSQEKMLRQYCEVQGSWSTLSTEIHNVGLHFHQGVAGRIVRVVKAMIG